MASLNLGQDEANKRAKNKQLSDCGQILSPIACCSIASLRFSYKYQPLCRAENEVSATLSSMLCIIFLHSQSVKMTCGKKYLQRG